MVGGYFYEQRKYICGPLKSSFITTETYNARLRINPRNSLYWSGRTSETPPKEHCNKNYKI